MDFFLFFFIDLLIFWDACFFLISGEILFVWFYFI